jgi:hypothetical protein
MASLNANLIICFLVMFQFSYIACQYSAWTPGSVLDCTFPFTFNGVSYSDCTTNGNMNSFNYAWCAFEANYSAVWKFCNDMTTSTWTCSGSSFPDPSGSGYPVCDIQNAPKPYMYVVDQIPGLSLSSQDHTALNGNCDATYLGVSKYHTACLNPAPNCDTANSCNVSPDDMETILNLHNQFRVELVFPAAAMQKMYWDNDLATLACKHAERCSFAHDDPTLRIIPIYTPTTGQNIAMATSGASHTWIEQFSDMLNGERHYFCYGNSSTTVNGAYSGLCAGYTAEPYHYTQVLLESASAVGCAKSTCVYPDRIEQYWVCNYRFMQTASQAVYPYTLSTNGQTCQNCPNTCTMNIPVVMNSTYSDFTGVRGGLCDCGGNACQNGGVLNVATCSCNCTNLPSGFWQGQYCQTAVPQTSISVNNGNGHCYFPFSWDGQDYYKCNTDDGPGNYWCATVMDPYAAALNGASIDAYSTSCLATDGITV